VFSISGGDVLVSDHRNRTAACAHSYFRNDMPFAVTVDPIQTHLRDGITAAGRRL
jgi:hypothetical protein